MELSGVGINNLKNMQRCIGLLLSNLVPLDAFVGVLEVVGKNCCGWSSNNVELRLLCTYESRMTHSLEKGTPCRNFAIEDFHILSQKRLAISCLMDEL